MSKGPGSCHDYKCRVSLERLFYGAIMAVWVVRAHTFRVRSSGAPAIIQSDCFHISFVKSAPLLCQTIPSLSIDLLQATNPISLTVMCLSHASLENLSSSLCPGLWLRGRWHTALPLTLSKKNKSIIIPRTSCHTLGMLQQNIGTNPENNSESTLLRYGWNTKWHSKN